jgi:hypothetical protein
VQRGKGNPSASHVANKTALVIVTASQINS